MSSRLTSTSKRLCHDPSGALDQLSYTPIETFLVAFSLRTAILLYDLKFVKFLHILVRDARIERTLPRSKGG